MKKLLYIAILCFTPFGTKGQATDNRNYIKSTVFTAAGGTSKIENIQYFDGLGKAVQSIDIGITPSGGDLITLTEYDELNRPVTSWLPVPVTGNNGRYHDIQTLKNKARTVHSDNNPYQSSLYENNSLNRVVGTVIPGEIYRQAGKSKVVEYAFNTDADKCIKFSVQGSGTSTSLVQSGFWQSNTLYREAMTDEDGNISYVFKNQLDNIILSRQINGVDKLDTYYVYDDYGNLCFVISPELSAQTTINQAGLDRYSYQYKYDSRNRLIEKKLPGADVEKYEYDAQDRLTRSQDGFMRNAGIWKNYVYDSHNRIIEVKAGNTVLENYSYDSYTSVPSTLVFSANMVAASYDTRAKGQLTYSKKSIVNSSTITTFGFVQQAYYYDYMGRVVQLVELNHLGGVSRTSYSYDFTGNILSRHESHQSSANATADILLSTYQYDKAGRLISERTQLNNGTAADVRYEYNEIGQLNKVIYGGGNYAFGEVYEYNTQGWLTAKQTSFFEMKLRYYDAQKTQSTKKYTGDISEWEWKQKQGTTVLSNYVYGFDYDQSGRLTDSRLYENNSASPVNKFTEKGLTYDRNGNIKTLKRYSSTGALTDNFTYNYIGNQLTSLTGSHSATYTYDANGNMTKDGLENITLDHNYLNLVAQVKSGTTVKAHYRWLSDGQKLGVNTNTTNTGDGFEYIGSLVYKRTSGTLALESAGFGGGRIYKSSSTYTPHYFVTDHLGSPRAVIEVTSSANNILGRHDYMPFGQAWENPAMQTGTNRYLYNGKEKQTTGGLAYLDYGWRMSNNRLGIMNGMDGYSEKRPYLTPYSFVDNNPVNNIELDGRDWYTNTEGEYMWMKRQDDNYIDDDGVEWQNAGTSMLFTHNDGRITLFDQRMDENGEIFLTSQALNLDMTQDGFPWEDFGLAAGSIIAGGIAYQASQVAASYGTMGNSYVIQAANWRGVARFARGIGTGIGIGALLTAQKNYNKAQNFGQRINSALDIGVSGYSIMNPSGMIPTYYNIGGKYLMISRPLTLPNNSLVIPSHGGDKPPFRK